MKKILSLILAATMLFTTLALTACGTTGGKVKLVDVKLTEEEYAFAVSKGNTALLTELNDFLTEIRGNGVFDSIVNKYFGNGTPTPVTSAATMKNDGSQLIVATNAAFEPFEYKVGSNYYGIDMEIMSLFAQDQGKELYIYNMPFDAVCLSVATEGDPFIGEDDDGNPVEISNGICHIAAAGLTVTDKRKESLDFTASYYGASQMLIVPADNTAFDACTDAASVKAILDTFGADVKVGVQNGTTGKLYCIGDAEMEFPGYAFTTIGYDNGALAVQNIINGNCDYVIIDEGPAKAIVSRINAAN